MTQMQIFGGDWTEEKLLRIKKYLSAYTTILINYPFRTAYIDAFAGTGYREQKRQDPVPEPLFPDLIDIDTQGFLQGSAQIALQIEPRFNKYIFIEQAENKYIELQRLKDSYPDKANDIMTVNDDCNTFLQDLCLNKSWKNHRAVLFLDPFGMQVEWETIEAIARTEAIDLWLLFPLGVAVNRLLRKDGQISEKWKSKLDSLFGTEDWFDRFYQEETVRSLFGEEAKMKKIVNLEQIGEYFVSRLKTIFSAVAENPLALCNSRNNPIYLLCFAAGNPKGAKTAVKIAQYILSH
jgi:three-Cys-motif partner protein